MSDLLKRIENEALNLSEQERAFLADRLLSSLGVDAHTEIDAAWIAEAERRYLEYREGKRPGFAANQVFSEADRILK
jgi:putative addiction module component (TIGR02574 family)